MQTNIICRRYSTFVFSTQWHLLYIYKLRIINNIFWVLALRALICMKQMMDPAGIANWSVTYVDWSEGKWHPRSFRAKDVTYERLKNMTVCLSILHIILTWLSWSLLMSLTSIFLQSIDVSIHITSDEKVPSSLSIWINLHVNCCELFCVCIDLLDYCTILLSILSYVLKLLHMSSLGRFTYIQLAIAISWEQIMVNY